MQTCLLRQLSGQVLLKVVAATIVVTIPCLAVAGAPLEILSAGLSGWPTGKLPCGGGPLQKPTLQKSLRKSQIGASNAGCQSAAAWGAYNCMIATA